MNGLAYDAFEDGHRRSYLNTWARELGFEGLIEKPSFAVLIKLVRASHLIFSTLDDVPFFFLFVGLLRSLMGKRTVGIFLRPQVCFLTYRWRYRFKRVYFRILSSLPLISPVSIVPYFINPRFAEVSRNWIYDPQNWDLFSDRPDLAQSTPLAESILAHARGRKIIAAIGGLNRYKAFDYFAAIASSPLINRDAFCFIACGPLAHDCHDEARMITETGGFVVGEFIADADIWAIYGIADAVWASYPPDHDQASGIFGRASQLGVPAIVRSGSFNAIQAERMGAPALAIPFGLPDQAIDLIHGARFSNSEPDWTLVQLLKTESLERLKTLL